jgi:CheY-like chemotaxis protein
LLSLVDEKPTQPEAIPEPEPDDFEQSIDLEALLFECSDNAAALAKQKKVQINILTLTKTHTIGSLKSLRHVVESLFEGALTKLHGGSINIDSGFDALKHLLFVRFKITGKWHTDDVLRLLTDTESAGSNPAWNEIKYLATAKRRLEMMKARLDIHSGKGSGTIITIYLQPDDKTRETYEPKSSIFYTVSPELIYLNDLYPHLLIIEDDPGSSKMLEITLKPISKLELAQNGHDAIAMVESFFARGIILDLVLLDIGLPEPWDGITLRKHFIEQFPSYRRVPFIAETAFVGRQEKERIIESGFDGFISKPIDRRFLIKTLASTLKRARGDNGS